MKLGAVASLTSRTWPRSKFQNRVRGITGEEHQKLVAREKGPDGRSMPSYELPSGMVEPRLRLIWFLWDGREAWSGPHGNVCYSRRQDGSAILAFWEAR